MSKKVTVIVEGREYIVEVGDLSESPVKATVNQRTYKVELPRQTSGPTGPEAPAVAAMPKATTREQKALSSANSAIIAPMPGNIVEVKVRAGDNVRPGDAICVLEAMKMNNMIYSDVAGLVATVEVAPGQAVDYGAVLVTLQ